MRCSALGDRLGVVIANLIEVRIGVFETWPGEDPVKVRVCEIGGVATGGAVATRGVLFPAQEPLCDPDRQALLPDASWALKQNARWQLPGANACREALTKLLVPKKIDDCHIEIWLQRR